MKLKCLYIWMVYFNQNYLNILVGTFKNVV